MRRHIALSLALTACASSPKSGTGEAVAAFDPRAVRTCVAVPAKPLGGPTPQLPPELRSSGDGGDRGDALAQFWVLPTGRAHMPSVRFLGRTNPAFAREVRRVLPSWRFEPALASADSDDFAVTNDSLPCLPGVPGTPVAARVQLPFHFAVAPTTVRSPTRH